MVHINGVSPEWLAALGLAPAARSNSIPSTYPFPAAFISGVDPYRSAVVGPCPGLNQYLHGGPVTVDGRVRQGGCRQAVACVRIGPRT